MASPTQRTLQFLRREGWTCAVVEFWNPHAKIRKDLFGFGDILAIHPILSKIMLVQTTTRPNLTSRIKKAKQLPGLLAWIRSGGIAEFWGWEQIRDKWQPRRVQVTEAEIDTRQIIPRRERKKEKAQPNLFAWPW